MALPIDSDLTPSTDPSTAEKRCSDITPIKHGRPKNSTHFVATNVVSGSNLDIDTPTFTGVLFSDAELLRLGKAQAARMVKQAKILEYQKTLVKQPRKSRLGMKYKQCTPSTNTGVEHK